MRRLVPSIGIVRRLLVVVLLTPGLRLAASSASGDQGFPEVFDSEKAPGGPMSGAESAATIAVPPGFRSVLFAAEPEVRQPIAITTDARGRLWVAENYTYSERGVGFHPELRDRIVILEDVDNDGRHDKRTVFQNGAQRLTSVEIGLGGVWALTLPHLVFIPDRDGDDRPDGPPEVHLDGFDFERARHNVANGLRWGPDGWLYGRHGILATSAVGPPGTPEAERTRVSVGIWRYHPQRRAFEVVAHGTTNPWGMDWDAHGEPFFINTVIGHLWHLIPGAHYRRMYGDDPDPRVYELIDQHADHVHWATGEVWTTVRQGVSQATLAAGGGHAHVGLLVYQGGQWPEPWTGRLLTANFHGRRLNVERLDRVGSGFVGRHEPDAFLFADPWFRPTDIIAAPDGGVFVSDWSDTGECHDNDGVSRSTGRIYKLVHGDGAPREPADLTTLSPLELVGLQTHANDWLARQARRVLDDRAQAGRDPSAAVAALAELERTSTESVHRLRALWARHVIGASDEGRLTALLDDEDEHVRIWAIRLLLDLRAASADALAAFGRNELAVRAAIEPSPRVRLALASALQRLPEPVRAPVASGLLRHSADEADHNLPLLLWYGIEPLAGLSEADATASFESLLADARIATVLRLGARRLAEEIETNPHRIDRLLTAVAKRDDPAARRAVLEGLGAALSGRRRVAAPPSWHVLRESYASSGDEVTRARVRDLDALFGDGRALEEIRAVALDPEADLPQRRTALQSLIDARDPGVREVSERLLRVRDLATTAAAGLSRFDDPAIADLLLDEWARLYGHEKAPVMDVLVSRPQWAARALAALRAGRLARTDITATQARQIRTLDDPALLGLLTEFWGEVRDRSEIERDHAFETWRRRLSPESLSSADLARGRETYRMLCAACHRLEGEGGAFGPDLTGSNRDNLEYLLENILFPSAIVPDEYRLTTLTMKDGRVLGGVVVGRTEHTLRFQTESDIAPLDRRDIAREERSALSVMPEGLLDAVGQEEVRDLVAYLMNK